MAAVAVASGSYAYVNRHSVAAARNWDDIVWRIPWVNKLALPSQGPMAKHRFADPYRLQQLSEGRSAAGARRAHANRAQCIPVLAARPGYGRPLHSLTAAIRTTRCQRPSWRPSRGT